MNEAAARVFLESYFKLKQKHEQEWEDRWQEHLRPFFGEYFLELRSQEDNHWAVLPTITDSVIEDDDTLSLIAEAEDHHTKRYFITSAQGDLKIDRIMIQCSMCNGIGQVIEGDAVSSQLDTCPLCDGRGWDDWLD